MPMSNERDDDTTGETPPLGTCPICERPAGDCDHLVASIDRTFSEIIGGALFARSHDILGMMERLVAIDPEALEAAGAGPALEHVAAIVAAEVDEGESPGDALAANALPMLAALSYMLQEGGDVELTEGDEGPGEVPSFEALWSEAPEAVVDRLAERLQALVDAVEA
jgi:hypothetical protein